MPEYLFRRVHLRSAFVRDQLTPSQSFRQGVGLGYFLKVEFDNHADSQTLYPRGWQKRVGYVRVSKLLFTKEPHSVDIFCQYSRLLNTTISVRCWIAR
jgi:hypothetical protein